ncbi:hypothetical protein [Amycolatopsis taiwanensis]|uniref:DUF4352 domain-containing protein n=1 Tax=Amycolatopsis taiwanensis TaxID=342230 RepID=A0A9W6VIZ8_9PSEU|nr:hypothetical protein [Amycolatopsis taiwanensis]GLY67986.1 hypothetical protein Atai01_46050 [Amycolatopsis taiwanensis]
MPDAMIENSTARAAAHDPYERRTPRPPWRKIAIRLLRLVVGALIGAGVGFGVHHVISPNYGTRYIAVPLPAIPSLPSLRAIPKEPIETKVGEQVVYSNPGSRGEVAFTVTKITLDGKCTEQFASGPENGHYIFVDLTVETSPDIGPGYGTELFNPLNFSLMGPDGVTQTGNALMSNQTSGCLSRGRALPVVLGAGQKYQGTVVLDARTTSGALTLAPLGGGLRNADSWKWRLGETT